MNFKIGIIGMEKTGKTSLINTAQYKYNFETTYNQSHVCAYRITFDTSIGPINLDIWDINDNDQPAYKGYMSFDYIYIGADAFILNYDCSDISSVNELFELYKDIKFSTGGKKLITVGCKSDSQNHEINHEQFNTLPLMSGHFITSVNQPDTCCNMFESLIKILVNNQDITFNSVE